jgi:hypothetical protein
MITLHSNNDTNVDSNVENAQVVRISYQGSAVSMVSGYGLDNWEIEIRSPSKAKGFFL